MKSRKALLLERYSGKQPRVVIAGGLGVSRQRRILCFIESHLHEDLSLERLAAAVDLDRVPSGGVGALAPGLSRRAVIVVLR